MAIVSAQSDEQILSSVENNPVYGARLKDTVLAQCTLGSVHNRLNACLNGADQLDCNGLILHRKMPPSQGGDIELF